MEVTSPEALARLLSERLAEGGDPFRPVPLSELLNHHLSYPYVRATLDLAGKGEYDVAVLNLLTDPTRLDVDPAVLAAAKRELATPEPALGFSGPLADRVLRIRTGGVPEEIEDPEESPEREESAEPEELAEPGPDSAPECWDCEVPLPRREGVRYCPRCGADQEVPRCPDCRELVEPDWSYCSRCGRALTS